MYEIKVYVKNTFNHTVIVMKTKEKLVLLFSNQIGEFQESSPIIVCTAITNL